MTSVPSHDLDHPGVPNFTLVKEEAEVAKTYDNKSVAEQNSVDIAWNVLMDFKYNDLRAAICGTESELKHFRQLVINVVLSTDIFDQELKALREARWKKAFAEEYCVSKADNANRRATIVMEHVIQASDVSHTMQHWTVYEKVEPETLSGNDGRLQSWKIGQGSFLGLVRRGALVL